MRCCGKPATANIHFDPLHPDPATSAAPHRVFNIGNSQPTDLLRFIEVMEQALGQEAIKDFHPMQPGDVVVTSADTQALDDWVGFKPFHINRDWCGKVFCLVSDFLSSLMLRIVPNAVAMPSFR